MELKAPYFINIKKKLEQEKAAGHKIYPAEDEIYTFTRCPLNDVRVVILGQDPYHGPGQAHGLCFSVKKGVPSPPSLVNIFKELKNEYGDAFETPKHGDLSGWCEQGVLLLNATLTVRAHNANSHSTWGWTTFTDKIISYINSHHENVVFILWGAYAQKKGQLVDKKKHLVLAGPHPSPLSAHRGFFGCKHFSKANDYLEQKGKTTVNWNSLP
ncbi:uracil-Dna glycosylase from atlantic Cod [Chytridium lagenaria]|nr:uracil-Dna glycosylase from atlantic Cod [Chytridium lagenaria]